MEILITGAQGFVGAALSGALLARGHRVTAVGRSAEPTRVHPDYRYISADTTLAGPWLEALAEAEAVINLAGKSIFTRWTKAAKEEIVGSRVATTALIAENLPAGRPVTLLSASGIGYYGDCGDRELTEASPAGDDFLARLAVQWEAQALRAAERGARVVCMRFGVVLGPGGGALATMVPVFRRYLGGRLGSGRQWFSWIHIDDLVAAALFALEHAELSGPVNFCAPNPVTNRELTRTLAGVLDVPALLPAPAFMLRLTMGEMAATLLGSQRALPARLERAGFQFTHPRLRPALAAALAA